MQPPAAAGQSAPNAPAPAANTMAPSSPPDAGAQLQAEFDAIDRDGDGRVSSSEHAANAKARFDAMDGDHNYALSADESRGTSAPSIADQIASARRVGPVDSNGNGEVSAEEARMDAEAVFRAQDADGDGALSADEMRAAGGMRATPR